MSFTYTLDRKKHDFPQDQRPKRDRQVYPWPTMKVGDSFFIETDDLQKIDKRVNASAWNYRRTKDPDFQIMTRPDVDEKNKKLVGLRVWRSK